MNTDIRLSCGFWSHPKTKRLVKRLGLEGVRSLQILWAWAAQERPSGCLSGMDAEAIELAADWGGEDGQFFGECVGRWIDEGEDGFCLHDWKDHNSWASEAENRSDAARLSRLARVNKDAAAGMRADGRVGITKEEYRLHSEGTPYVRRTTVPTTPAPSPAPATLTQEEIPSLRSGIGAAQLEVGPAHLVPVPQPEIFVFIPVNGDKDHAVTVEDLQEYKALYGNVDVELHLRKMRGYWASKPKNQRKTLRGIKTSINTWLAKEQDRARPGAPSRASPAYGPTTPRNYKECQDLERRQEAARLKAAINGQDAGFQHSQDGTRGSQLAALPHPAVKP